MPSQQVVDKAAVLIRDGKIEEEDARTFKVQGQGGIYTVNVWDLGSRTSCTCPCEGTCYHMLAALHLVRQDRPDRLINLLRDVELSLSQGDQHAAQRWVEEAIEHLGEKPRAKMKLRERLELELAGNSSQKVHGDA